MNVVQGTGLRREFGAIVALGGVDFGAAAGTVTAIGGPNGAGKSTLLRLLANLDRPTAGTIQWRTPDGEPMPTRPASLARAVAWVGPPSPVAFAWTAMEVVMMGRAPHLGRALEGPEDLAICARCLDQAGAGELGDRVFFELSAGQQQRVLIARAVAQQPSLLLLDEPTSHQDPAGALRIAALLRSLAEAGTAVVAVLHDLNIAAQTADVITLLRSGLVAASGTPDEICHPSVLDAVYGVTSRRVSESPPAVVFAAKP